MGSYLLTGALIGLLFGVPVGAVGAITAQRTMTYGPRIGFISGMGSSVADCLYACVGSFGWTFISNSLLENQIIINLIGGVLISLMGIKMLRNKKEVIEKHTLAANSTAVFLSSFAVGVTNPAAILTFLLAFSVFGISGKMEVEEGMQLVFGVLLGTLVWWITLVLLISKLQKKINTNVSEILNKVFGTMMLLFGLAIFIKVWI